MSAFGRTALHDSCIRGRHECVHLLLNYGAGHAIADGDGLHPITLACIKGHHETTRILLAHGAALSCRDEDGLMPLHWACIGGHHKCEGSRSAAARATPPHPPSHPRARTCVHTRRDTALTSLLPALCLLCSCLRHGCVTRRAAARCVVAGRDRHDGFVCAPRGAGACSLSTAPTRTCARTTTSCRCTASRSAATTSARASSSKCVF